WPHSSTSCTGVNQRMSNSSSQGTKNAVSDRLFSAAIACMVASGSQELSGQTAAGLPEKTRRANASTWNKRSFMAALLGVGARSFYLQADGAHERDGVGVLHDAVAHAVVEFELAVDHAVFEVDVARARAERVGHLREREIVRGDEANGAEIDEAAD